MRNEYEYYRNLEEHPFTGERMTSFDAVMSEKSFLDNYFNGNPKTEQVENVTRGKVYHIHKIKGYGDMAGFYFLDDTEKEQELCEFFFDPVEEKLQYHRYAQKYDDGKFHNVYTNYLGYYGGLVCNANEEIFDVTFEECEETEHDMVGWKIANTDEIDFIFASKLLLGVCFPYGMEAAIAAGQGQMVYLKTVDCKSCGKAGNLKQNRASWDK